MEGVQNAPNFLSALSLGLPLSNSFLPIFSPVGVRIVTWLVIDQRSAIWCPIRGLELRV